MRRLFTIFSAAATGTQCIIHGIWWMKCVGAALLLLTAGWIHYTNRRPP